MSNAFPTKLERFFSKMIPFSLKFKIDTILFDLMSNYAVFSADDIVTQLRDSNVTKLPRPILKAYVFSKLENFSGYSKTLREVGDNRFFIYAPFWADAEVLDYEPYQHSVRYASFRKKIDSLKESPVPTSPHTPVPLSPVQSMKVSPDKYNRLVIPKRVLSYLGFAPQQTVYIKKEPELGKVTVSPIPIDDTYTQRRVTKRGMIRISAATLDTESIYTATADVENNRVYVSV